MSILRNALIIAGKDLRAEAKSKQVLPTMLVFAALVIVVFSFAFDPNKESTKELIPGLIWIISIFAGILGLNRSFVSEQKNDNMFGMIIAPVDSVSIYLGKFLANYFMILIVQAVAVPILFLFFDFQFNGSLTWLILTIIIGTFGFVSIGTFLAAIAGNSGSSEMLLPLLLFPITTPVLIGVVSATKIILRNPDQIEKAYGWLQLVGGYDIIFFGICIILFDYILEV
ncbi:MAG: cytochrome c-type biosis protein CcmB [Bacillales bacterium]|jgi:heme exporter protein B|nr:cytochrome c-type biosis protein CcmB [Bacillales bacterium]